MRKPQSGFTLIELMATVAIVAILAVLAAPTFSDLIIKSRLRGATDDIVALLNNARGNAVKLEREINVSLDNSNAPTWCAGAIAEPGPSSVGAAATLSNTTCDCTSATACIVDNQDARVSSSSYSGVSVSVGSSNPMNKTQGGVTFDPKAGALTSLLAGSYSSPLVTLTAGKFSSQITVSPLGQTVVCVPSGSPFISGYPSC